MRNGVLLALALTCPLLGASCPLIDLDPPEATTGETLAISVLNPSTDHTVPLGDVVQIEWTAVNLTGGEAIAAILVEFRPDMAQTILIGGVRSDETQGSGVYEWDTTGFEAGDYAIIVTLEAGGLSRRETAAGQITLDVPPSFEFTAPATDTTLESGETVTISWVGSDPDGNGSVQIGVDSDTDHESGNETIIDEQALPTVSGNESLEWDGTNDVGVSVANGLYRPYAVVSDNVSPARIVNGLARITVAGGDNGVGPTETAVTEPEEDTDFLAADDPLTIEFTLATHDDVLIDLKIDTDDDHANGNETTILSQRLVSSDTDEDSFDWDGTDSCGDAVDDGIYRVFLVVSTGSGTPGTAEAEGLVFRRTDEDQPLIALLQPGSVETLDAGDYLSISWRDDDPTDEATIRITIDDDGSPNEGVEEGEAEIEILADRIAEGDEEDEGDGVLDTFEYQIPSSLAPGTYYVFAYIHKEAGSVAPDHQSIAPAVFIVRDPADAE
jgi:flagellar hook assembly protein FlgD